MKIKIRGFGLLNRLRETQAIARSSNELLPWQDMIKEFKNEGTYKYLKSCSPKTRVQLIRISTDLVDYFIDTANVTDKTEMGGFLMGITKNAPYTSIVGQVRNYILLQYFDFVMCRNVAENIEHTYIPDRSCRDEVHESVIEDEKYGSGGDYTFIHTHPDGSSVSPWDLVGYISDVEKSIALRSPVNVEMIIGDNEYVGTYSFYPHLISYVGDKRILTDGSYPFKVLYPDDIEAYVYILKENGIDAKRARRYMDALNVTGVETAQLREIRPEVKL